jgi:hypothetical protein
MGFSNVQLGIHGLRVRAGISASCPTCQIRGTLGAREPLVWHKQSGDDRQLSSFISQSQLGHHTIKRIPNHALFHELATNLGPH